MPPFQAGEIDDRPPEIQDEYRKYQAIDRPSGMVCVWLDHKRRCSRYEHRPQMCRDFERGGPDCRVVRRTEGILDADRDISIDITDGS